MSVAENFNLRLQFNVNLSAPAIEPVTIGYRLLSRTATGPDLTDAFSSSAYNGSVVIQPGQSTAAILVRPDADSIDEFDEFVMLELFDPVGAIFADSQAVLRTGGAILDDDGAG